MAKKLVFTVTGEVPDDEMDRAELLGKIKPHRDTFLAALKEAGITHTHETKVLTAKATPAAPRKKREPATPTAEVRTALNAA